MKATILRPLLVLIITSFIAGQVFANNHNLSSDTLLSIYGLTNLEYSYKAFEHVTFGISGASTSRPLKNKDIELNGNSFGGVIRYYANPAFHMNSVYFGAAYAKTNFEAKVTSGGTQYTGKSKDSFSMSTGYQLFWNSFNIALGTIFTSPSKIELKDAAGNKYPDEFNTQVGVELRIGGMF